VQINKLKIILSSTCTLGKAETCLSVCPILSKTGKLGLTVHLLLFLVTVVGTSCIDDNNHEMMIANIFTQYIRTG